MRVVVAAVMTKDITMAKNTDTCPEALPVTTTTPPANATTPAPTAHIQVRESRNPW